MKLKKVCIAIIVVMTVLVGIFLIGRYGWKLRGFAACEGAGIENIKVSENMVEIQGYDPSLVPAGFIGYYSEEVDGTLYVGFKFSDIFGVFETGDFQIQIPVEHEIKEICIKTKNSESLIWCKELPTYD